MKATKRKIRKYWLNEIIFFSLSLPNEFKTTTKSKNNKPKQTNKLKIFKYVIHIHSQRNQINN